MSSSKRDGADFREEVRAGIRDALKTDGVRFADVMREAAAYGVRPEEVAAVREEVDKEQMHGGIER